MQPVRKNTKIQAGCCLEPQEGLSFPNLNPDMAKPRRDHRTLPWNTPPKTSSPSFPQELIAALGLTFKLSEPQFPFCDNH